MYASANISASTRNSYALYQKEAQIIQVASQEQNAFISVPQMLPNFLNISMNEVQNMSYQLRSFNFKNTFNNIYLEDVIYLRLTLCWIKYEDGVKRPGVYEIDAATDAFFSAPETDDFYPIFLFPGRLVYTTSGLGSVAAQLIPSALFTATEIVDTLNLQLLEAAHLIILEQDLHDVEHPISIMRQNIIYFAQCAKFYFDPTSGKLGIVMTQANNVTTYTPYTKAATQAGVPIAGEFLHDNGNTYILQGIQMQLYADPAATATTQARISRYFGFADTLTSVNGKFSNKTYVVDTLPYGMLAVGGDTTERAVQIQAMVGYANDGGGFAGKGALYNNILKFTKGQAYGADILQAVSAFLPASMDVIRNKFVYVRTTLNTNYWDQYGKKSDIMDIIPIQKGFSEQQDERFHSTRIYQSKESSFQSFYISFTNENNEPLEFDDPYLLTIACFFSPNNST